MISYELAKELKDAGFRQPRGNTDGEKIKGFWFTTARQVVLDVFDLADPTPTYDPALSELIEACGDDFVRLVRDEAELREEGKTWFACAKGSSNEHLEAGGSTPEESVANLWLELNKKQ